MHFFFQLFIHPFPDSFANHRSGTCYGQATFCGWGYGNGQFNLPFWSSHSSGEVRAVMGRGAPFMSPGRTDLSFLRCSPLVHSG